MTVTDGFRRVLTVSCGHGSHPSVKLGQFDRTKIGLRGSIPSWPLWDMSPRLPALRRKTNSSPLHPGFSATMPGAIWCWPGVATGLLFAGLNWLPAWGGFLVGAVPTLLLCALSTRSAMSKEPASVSWFVLLSDRQPSARTDLASGISPARGSAFASAAPALEVWPRESIKPVRILAAGILPRRA